MLLKSIVALFLSGSIFICNAQMAVPSSLDWKNLDSTAQPSKDFYQFVCGNWLKNNPIPEEESRWSNFNLLEKQNNIILREIVEDAASKTSGRTTVEERVGNYYFAFTDTLTRNKLGITPILDILNDIAAIQSINDLENQIIQLHKIGFNVGFNAGVSPDSKINTKHILYLSQGGQGLPNKEYYTKNDDRSKMIRKEYLLYTDKLFTYCIPKSKKPSKSIFAMEVFFSNKSRSPVENRDLDKRYNKMTMGDLAKISPQFNWSKYFGERGLMVDSIIVSQPEYFTNFGVAIEKFSLDQWKNYLQWSVINSSTGFLNMDIERASFAFYSTTLRGTKTMKPLHQRALESMSRGIMGESLGQLFVERNFSISAKNKVNEMVDNITAVFEDRINKLDWMSEATKAKAQEKLAAFSRKLGFPDKWKEYPGFYVTTSNYGVTVIDLNAFRVAENVAKLDKPVDKNEWFMAPQIVNAYYSPTNNEIVFPAGIMQQPFFSEHYEDAVNYARMGAVIGHELTHGFDDNGSKFDASGRMQNWWTQEDREKFDAKTQLLIDQYNSIQVLEGVFINGKLTLGENIADLGGLTIAYHAYIKSLEGKVKENINGYTPEQRFFMAFGQIWQNNIRDAELVNRVNNDSHSPGKYRVNATLSNMPEFFEAFQIKEGDPMRQPAEKIARIW
jgi:putative endopeptidase